MLTRSNKTKTNNHYLDGGFALPTVLVASIIMLTVLLVSIASTASVRVVLSAQFYNQLAQNAGDAGVAYAKSCLAANGGVPMTGWTDSTPLKPDTDCNGVQLASCPLLPTTAACHSVALNENVASTFSVGVPVIVNGASEIRSVGSTNLLRTSNSTAWRQYKQTSHEGVASVTPTTMFGTGADLAATVSIGKNINTEAIAASRTCADAVNYSVTALSADTATVPLASAPTANCLTTGDEVLLINLQGISTSNSNVGNYETLRVKSISSNVITFKSNKAKFYGNGASDDTNLGATAANQRVMLQRVPNYTSLTVNAGITLTGNPWDSTKGTGGVLFFKTNAATSVSGIISMAGKGYKYGAYGFNAAYPATQTGYQGEGISGGSLILSTANYGGGGGGGYGSQADGRNAGDGGGGGGHATIGASGAEGAIYSGNGGVAGAGGNANGAADLNKAYLGTGGGGGGESVNAVGGNGGSGGGIIFITGSSVGVSGSIISSGTIGSPGIAADGGGGGGGGGSGGSVRLVSTTISLGANLVISNGGGGGGGGIGTTKTGGAGGSGGLGRIAIYSPNVISGTTSPAYAGFSTGF